MREYSIEQLGKENVVCQIARLDKQRDIVLHGHTGGLQRITKSHCAYDSLHYVLSVPSRENGWHLKILHSKGNRHVTAML